MSEEVNPQIQESDHVHAESSDHAESKVADEIETVKEETLDSNKHTEVKNETSEPTESKETEPVKTVESPKATPKESTEEKVVLGKRSADSLEDDDEASHAATKDAKHIATHYNQIKPLGRHDRQKSDILGVRNFNNWVKSVLIHEYSRSGATVLDLACGKGGDLPKWKRTSIRRMVGVDIAEVSVEEARRRYGEMRPRFEASYHVLDAFHRNWDEAVGGATRFDLISCQFALHYCFESEESARHAIASVSKHLQPGGLFFGTIPNYSAIRRKLLATPNQREISNDIYSLRLDEGTDLQPGYGQRYYFDLAEAIDSCPEYFIPFAMLESLAEEQGMEACMEMPFQAFFERHSARHMDLLLRMNIVDARGNMLLRPEDMEVAELYMAFCFRKKE